MGQRIYNEDGSFRVVGKRQKGDGSWTQRAGGGWAFEVMHDGQRLRTTGRTKTDARAAMKELIARVDQGLPARDAKVTLASWLAEWQSVHLEARQTKRGPMKATTKATYKTLCKKHLEPAPFGSTALDKLTPRAIERHLNGLRAAGMAESSLRQIYHILRLALAAAVRDGLLARNPAELVDRPVPPYKEAQHLSVADLNRLLDAAKAYRYHEVLSLIAATGMRRGEALALKWSDVDLVAGTLRVRGTLARVDGHLTVTDTKTEKSRRTIELSPGLVDLLARHRDAQEREAAAAANQWRDSGFVFTTAFGEPVDPRNVFRTLQAARKKAKLGPVGIHTLRHSWASAMIDNGANIKVVSELLGHSSVAITGDIYVHTHSEAKRAAVDSMSRLIGL